MLYKYYCAVIPKHSIDENEIKEVIMWVKDYGDFNETKDNLRQLAYEFGYELVEDYEIVAGNECVEGDGYTLEDRFYFASEEYL